MKNNFGIPEGIVAAKKEEIRLAKLAEQEKYRLEAAKEDKNSQPMADTPETGKENEGENKDDLMLGMPASGKLKHPTRTRPRHQHRRPSVGFSYAGPSFDPEKAEEKTMAAISRERLLEVLDTGFENYKKAVITGSTPGRPRGWLSSWRHGTAGDEKASTFQTTLHDAQTTEDVLKELDAFFSYKYTRYENHSLAAYLLDGINRGLQTFSLPSFVPDEKQHYDRDCWQRMKTVLSGGMPEEIEQNTINP
ncbi:hypothetical protein [Legionella spiritensis]|uniref:hypothetical protein n=1 Tax=Legionella spiritensis TaxID=452 RepID=UPI000F6C6578|nr:hypothetical protein [Legionella spiritensis]VEG91098.1 Uncharacterised protein [Legionella spiritensis]